MSTVLRACDGLPIKEFAAGEAVISEGSPAGVLYVLASGSVEVVKGDVQITTVAEPGSFFGEMSVLLARPHTSTVRALEPSTFHVIEDPLAFLRADPASTFELARLLARRLHFVNSYLVDLEAAVPGAWRPPLDGRRGARDAGPPSGAGRGRGLGALSGSYG